MTLPQSERAGTTSPGISGCSMHLGDPREDFQCRRKPAGDPVRLPARLRARPNQAPHRQPRSITSSSAAPIRLHRSSHFGQSHQRTPHGHAAALDVGLAERNGHFLRRSSCVPAATRSRPSSGRRPLQRRFVPVEIGCRLMTRPVEIRLVGDRPRTDGHRRRRARPHSSRIRSAALAAGRRSRHRVRNSRTPPSGATRWIIVVCTSFRVAQLASVRRRRPAPSAAGRHRAPEQQVSRAVSPPRAHTSQLGGRSRCSAPARSISPRRSGASARRRFRNRSDETS